MGVYRLVSAVRLYSNDCTPILKQPFAYRQTLQLHFSMGVAWGSKRGSILTNTAPSKLLCISTITQKGQQGQYFISFYLSDNHHFAVEYVNTLGRRRGVQAATVQVVPHV